MDFTPQAVPAYAEVSDSVSPAMKGYFMDLYERQATARRAAAAPVIIESLDRNDPGWRDRFNEASRLGKIDPMYEAVERGEREARARFKANPHARGFDG